MKGVTLTVKLNKIGLAKLETPIEKKIIMPIADEPEKRNSWLKLFDGAWPNKSGVMEKVDFADVVSVGLEVLARRQTVHQIIAEYRDAHPGSGRRGRSSKKEIITI